MKRKDKILLIIVLLTVIFTLLNIYLIAVNHGSTEEIIMVEIEGVLKLLELFLDYYF